MPAVQDRHCLAFGETTMPAVLLLMMLLPSAAMAQPLLELRVGEAVLQAEYAVTAAERARGLMHRTELPADRGMLF
ncbi:DUF192 domain-containing protein, partial [Klebsiella pneumoniae]|nr:DUF192 domain-containing protein [Klebsiella pneumoniae]